MSFFFVVTSDICLLLYLRTSAFLCFLSLPSHTQEFPRSYFRVLQTIRNIERFFAARDLLPLSDY